MGSYKLTNAWKSTLAPRPEEDSSATARSRLAASFESFRKRCEVLANEIPQDLREYTVHDITHIDALWEMTDLIGGPELKLTPIEAFVLGGAFLIHDLGNGLAAYPSGMAEFRNTTPFKDALASVLRGEYGRPPKAEELASPSDHLMREAVGIALRTMHALRAEKLALISWRDLKENLDYHLIEDVDLRRTYGQIIGKIAHSHWWPTSILTREFPSTIGAPASFPREWTVNPLKLACLIRTADYSQIDERRAPAFLKVLRKPVGEAAKHWTFQSRLQQPQLDGDRLLYTSGSAFPESEAASWWLCYDTLTAIDRELQGVDGILLDEGQDRFAARGVASIDDPKRLVRHIPTDGWLPIDAKLRVSDVVNLARTLGGSALYGDDLTVPLRELIQNAADAIRARRKIEKRGSSWGEIKITLGQEGKSRWVEVTDIGVGMSSRTLSGPFLDFGKSFWSSDQIRSEFPGLCSTDFESTGRYGIGFFSVFMWGNRVTVRSRRYDEGHADTNVLEFEDGATLRPLLRRARHDEYLIEGGTSIKIWLTCDFPTSDGYHPPSLAEFIAWLCPASDCTITADDGNGTGVVAVQANDWIALEGEQLLRRIWNSPESTIAKEIEQLARKLGPNLRLLADDDAGVIGRIAVGHSFYRGSHNDGLVTVGGLRSCETRGLCGILVGKAARAARDHALPVATAEHLKVWSAEQIPLVKSLELSPDDETTYTETLWRCGGDIDDLHVARVQDGWLTYKAAAARTSWPDEIFLIETYGNSDLREQFEDFILDPDVVECDSGYSSIISGRHFSTWPDIDRGFGLPYRTRIDFTYTIRGAFLQALASSWKVSVAGIVKASGLESQREAVFREVLTAGTKRFSRHVTRIVRPASAAAGNS